MPHRKLIEVSLPLDEINKESAREKSIRHGHPSTLHLWWARRPLAAARAVLFAQLVDDPSSHPALFPTPAAQRAERQRLHDIIRRLVPWENTNNEAVLREAHAEIVKYAPDGKPPAILDPFAGGGTIPLEAQRLGLEAHASDLNPVAVLINKALIEIPPKFADRPPVFPGLADTRSTWRGAEGLAADVRAYGEWMRDEAEKRIGHLYPKAKLPDGTEAAVIAWIWARTVTCPNPACRIEMPLVRSWWLGKKKGKEAYVVPRVVDDPSEPSGKRVAFEIGHDPKFAPTKENDGTVGRTGAKCIACGSAVDLAYVRAEGKAGRMGARLTAVVAEGNRRRLYLPPTDEHLAAAQVERPDDVHQGELPAAALGFRVQGYGMAHWADLFTNRQLTALTTFSNMVEVARVKINVDAGKHATRSAELIDGRGRPEEYSDAVATYLALGVSKATDYQNSLCPWLSDVKNEGVGHLFSRQAIPMVWDYCEANPFSVSSGNLLDQYSWIGKVVAGLPARRQGSACQAEAARYSYERAVVSTDPPYYDNIGYSDLSDFFYVWLRRSLRDIHPDLFRTLLVPKDEELVANPYRHNGRDGAEKFFEAGFGQVFTRIRASAPGDYPITVYYAFKQAEVENEGIASTGWATVLQGVIRSGWAIIATWPLRTERVGRMRAIGSNALASSIVLVLRPRPAVAETTTRRGFLAALHAELPSALAAMRETSIAPVDLAQATIGPGMAIFSRYAEVVEANGDPMPVRTALALINQALDEVLAEQDADLDADTRFCLTWYQAYGWDRHDFGDAEGLARRFNVAVDGIARGGVLTAREGWVTLTRPADLSAGWDPSTDDRISHWEATLQLARVLAEQGIDAAAQLLTALRTRSEIDLDAVHQLALRLYRLAERKDPADAGLFNALGTEWTTLEEAAPTDATDQPALPADEPADALL